jgi:hypothetical protein
MACIEDGAIEVLKSMLPRIITNKPDAEIKAKVTKAFEVFNEFKNNRDAGWTDQSTELLEGKDAPLADGINKILNHKDKEVRDKVNDAMNMASMLTMKSMIDYRMENDNKLEDDVKGVFANVLGSVDSDGYDDKVSMLVNSIKRGQALPTSLFARTAGAEAIRQLEIRY